MKKMPNWMIITVIIILLILSKFFFFAKKEEKSGRGKGKNNAPVAVNYYVIEPDTFNNDVFATGKIGALNQIDLMPEVNGKVTAIYFKEGESVSKGSLLVKLNDADLQAQLLKNKTQLKLAEQKLERLKKLLEIKGVSQEDFDAQDNEVNSLKADNAFLSAQIAKTSIVAPFSGVIGLKNISEGSFVSSNTAIVSLVQTQPLYVEFSLPEKYSSLLKIGLPVSFLGDGLMSGKMHEAVVYAIEPRVDEITKTIRARAMYRGNDKFYPGSFVKVYANLEKIKDALMVPTQCVIPTLKGQKVFKVKNGTAEETMVTIGVRTDDKIQVLSGVQMGDTIVSSGLLSVKKDSKVKLLKSQN